MQDGFFFFLVFLIESSSLRKSKSQRRLKSNHYITHKQAQKHDLPVSEA